MIHRGRERLVAKESESVPQRQLDHLQIDSALHKLVEPVHDLREGPHPPLLPEARRVWRLILQLLIL